MAARVDGNFCEGLGDIGVMVVVVVVVFVDFFNNERQRGNGFLRKKNIK